MDIQEMINAYEEINANIEPLLEHDLRAVQIQARILIDRNNRSIRELNEYLRIFER